MWRSRAAKWATRMAQMCRSQAIKWAMRSRHRKIAAEVRASPAGRRREPAGRICERSAGSASLHVLLMVTARTTTPPIPLPKSSSTASRLYLFANSGFLASPMYSTTKPGLSGGHCTGGCLGGVGWASCSDRRFHAQTTAHRLSPPGCLRIRLRIPPSLSWRNIGACRPPRWRTRA